LIRAVSSATWTSEEPVSAPLVPNPLIVSFLTALEINFSSSTKPLPDLDYRSAPLE
jgi:hypothetical protein